MNKQLLVAALFLGVSSVAQVQATDLCTGTAGDSVQIDGVTDGSKFITSDLKIKCSKNTQIVVDQTATGVGVCANSIKGKTTFKGGSETGAVAKSDDCKDSSGKCAKAVLVLSTDGKNTVTCDGK